MGLFPLFSLVLVVAAGFSYLNHRFVKLPTTIGVMLIALAMSVGLILADLAGLGLREPATALLDRIDFDDALLDVMLAFLLFAGALHVDLDDLREAKWTIGLLATFGLMLATALTGGLIYFAAGAVGVDLPLLHCMVFGALISPTDPIAVLGILASAGAPKELKTKIVGESLFNDGVAVVLFSVLAAAAAGGAGHGAEAMDAAGLAQFVAQEVLLALVLGLGAGYVTFRLLKSVDNYQVEVLITLALACGLYSLAAALHSSGPLAVVVAGLFIGNTGRTYAMSETTARHIDTFWELADGILNVVLFLLIGLELLHVDLRGSYLLLGLVAVVVSVLARFCSVGLTALGIRRVRRLPAHTVKILTWGGIRGGISVALALSLPRSLGESREIIIAITYVVVVFSIFGQGLTIGRVIRALSPTQSSPS